MIIWMRFPEGRKKTLTLSYDDGVQQDKRLCEILDKYGIKCTFNLGGGQLAPDDGVKHWNLSVSDAKELFTKYGQDIAAHGYRHMNLSGISPAQMAYDMITDRAALEKEFDRSVRGMAYAYGAYNDKVVDMLRSCGFCYARTTRSTESFGLPSDWLKLDPTAHHNNPRLMELAKTFAEHEIRYGSAMFYLWGHSYEFDNNDNWNVIEEFCEYMSGRDDIWYASNTEIYEYVEAYNQLIWRADSSAVFNPTCRTLWFQKDGKTYSIASGETLKL
ncbi:MAG: polysaccharide deacetylase family protein [Clostridia bacterium]|nr:polysaccharide deacetylase family protein [Clostridia bacterium]